MLVLDEHHGVVPETVHHGNLEVGRFEVTRAQYLAWDNAYPFQKGTEDYPANLITFAEAQGYAEWLSARTGEKWRLPTEEEFAALGVSASENVGSGALKEVGSFEAKDGIYDLGGNVAEWVVTRDGKGKIAGRSAAKKEVTPEFTGFRVVKGK
jgi:formylglycine-generating enzyme required for sulfatase activity